MSRVWRVRLGEGLPIWAQPVMLRLFYHASDCFESALPGIPAAGTIAPQALTGVRPWSVSAGAEQFRTLLMKTVRVLLQSMLVKLSAVEVIDGLLACESGQVIGVRERVVAAAQRAHSLLVDRTLRLPDLAGQLVAFSLRLPEPMPVSGGFRFGFLPFRPPSSFESMPGSVALVSGLDCFSEGVPGCS